MIGMILMTLFNTSILDHNSTMGTEFKFTQLLESQYAIVNDGVMGGRSSSELNVLPEVVNYQGKISLENNGGFASVRMVWPFEFPDLENEPTVAVLRLKGDGLTYQFRLRTNRGFDGAAYSYSFKTIAGKEQTVYIPINDFVPTFRGRKLRNMPKLKFSDVQQMGVLVADYQTGEFEVDLYSLTLQ